jgi:ribosome-associated protein
LDSLKFARFIVDAIEDKKGENITLLDLRPDALMADFLIIANGSSDRQLRALTDHVQSTVKETFRSRPYAVDGTPRSGWVLLDFGDVVVNLFTEDERDYYDLEGLWRDRSQVLLSIQ